MLTNSINAIDEDIIGLALDSTGGAVAIKSLDGTSPNADGGFAKRVVIS